MTGTLIQTLTLKLHIFVALTRTHTSRPPHPHSQTMQLVGVRWPRCYQASFHPELQPKTHYRVAHFPEQLPVKGVVRHKIGARQSPITPVDTSRNQRANWIQSCVSRVPPSATLFVWFLRNWDVTAWRQTFPAFFVVRLVVLLLPFIRTPYQVESARWNI